MPAARRPGGRPAAVRSPRRAPIPGGGGQRRARPAGAGESWARPPRQGLELPRGVSRRRGSWPPPGEGGARAARASGVRALRAPAGPRRPATEPIGCPGKRGVERPPARAPCAAAIPEERRDGDAPRSRHSASDGAASAGRARGTSISPARVTPPQARIQRVPQRVPSRLEPNTARLIAAPGNSTRCGAFWAYSAAETDSMRPQTDTARARRARGRQRRLDEDALPSCAVHSTMNGPPCSAGRGGTRCGDGGGRAPVPPHVLHLADRQDAGPHDARRPRDDRDRDGDHHVPDRGAERGRHDQGEHEERQPLEDVEDPLDDQVGPPAGVAGEEPHDPTQAGAEERGREPHDQRDAGAVDDAGVDVAPEVVVPSQCPEPAGPACGPRPWRSGRGWRGAPRRAP